MINEKVKNFTHWNYAHRGLYNNPEGIPENSLTAFRLARENGYGVELDVQLTNDGYVVVFHDDSLDRVCGVSGSVRDFTLAELQEMRLFGTDQTIPLFTDVLETLFGGISREKPVYPLIVELKNCKQVDELCGKTYEILKNYQCPYCVESFNPFMVNWFKKNAPDVVRGQLSNHPSCFPKMGPVSVWFLSNCHLSFINRPDFIAYYPKAEPLPRHIQNLRKKGTMLVYWTSRVPGDADYLSPDAVIFEGYRPDSYSAT